MFPDFVTGDGAADAANVVAGPNYRITVLDAGLVRLEYDESGRFEDRPSQSVVDRAFPPADFSVTESDDLLEVHTDRLHLSYDKKSFSTEGLSVQAKGGFHSSGSVWRFGLPTRNLGGTARTLDEVDGPCPLEPGILSRDGITVVDDSGTVVLGDDGWVVSRRPGTLDLYVFAFGRDYHAALAALYKLTGPQPLLPRFALGNWWSRYHAYSADEYLELLDNFDAVHAPLSVAVLDMDWHWVEIDPRYGSGWTGYSWNTDLFPDPKAFLEELHRRGLAVSLNVHPAEGVHAHETAYPAIAQRLGIDPASELPVVFDPTDPEFMTAYLEELHHPLEAEGVDFWWLDWQQGGVTRIRGLDPLWLLNHVHYLDSGRDGRRPLTFSRYAGIGSHRYPVGFSGDTVISWASLDFQPYFTATASNVGYGWWSHDLGGHFFGEKDDELAVRWVQFGVFSPITRLHSSKGLFNTKEPWRFGAQAEHLMERFLSLRHRLVPYLYTMNRRAHTDHQPLVQPMYYDHPEVDHAYDVPNQYMFGDQLLVAPITTPRDEGTLHGAVTAWLPPGPWIDVFTGLTYRGDRSIVLHRDLDSIPVLARAGAIVPMTPARETAGTANPETLELWVFAGADGSFTVAEDADDEQWALTTVTFDAATGAVRIGAVEGTSESIPERRRYEIVLCGARAVDAASVTVDGATQDVEVVPGPIVGSVRLALPQLPLTSAITVQVQGDPALRTNDDVRQRVFRLLDQAQIGYALKEDVYAAFDDDLVRLVPQLTALAIPPALRDAIVELVTANPA